jgi:4-hydroxy-tetrahydrodipicolinate synthase
MKQKEEAGTLQFKGLLPPMVLPLTHTGETDWDSLESQIEFLFEGGADGLWVNGSTGDFFALRPEERSEVVSVTASLVRGRGPVIAQVGDTSTRLTVSHAERALEAGADAVALVPPYYADYSQVELKEHYRTVSKQISQPVFVYQIPQMTKVSFTIASLLELAAEGTIVGIKDSAGDIDFYSRLIRELRRNDVALRCFYGASSLADVSLYVGGHGIMCGISNLVPHLCKDVYVSSLAGEWKTAQLAMSKILDLIDAMILPGRTNWAPTVASYKWVLRNLGVIATHKVFEPLKPLTPSEEKHLKERALPLCQRRV